MGLVSRETVTRAEYAVIAGPQIHASSHASLTAAIATIGSTEADLLIANTTTCTANTTVPSNVRLVMTRQGRINQGTYTLTINGPFEAGLSQVFSGTGAVTFGRPAKDLLPEWWGAIADSTGTGTNGTDNTTALQKAATSAGITHRLRLSTGIYRITSTVETFALTVSCPIVGNNPGLSVLYNSGTGSALKTQGVGYYSRFSGFGVKGNASSQDGIVTNTTGVSQETAYCLFSDIDSYNHGRHGLVQRYSWATKWMNCKFYENGGIGIYLYANTADAHVAINNVVFLNCDSRWNGGTAAGTTYADMKGGVRIDGAAGVYFIGGVYESNNAWNFVINPTYWATRVIVIENIYTENCPNGASVGGNFYFGGSWAGVSIKNNWLGYLKAATMAYCFYVAGRGTNSVLDENNNFVYAFGTGNSNDFYGVTLGQSYPITSEEMGDVGGAGNPVTADLITASNDGSYMVSGTIYISRTGTTNQHGVFPFMMKRDSYGSRSVEVAATSMISAVTTAPTMAFSGDILQVTFPAYEYGYVVVNEQVGGSPTTFTFGSTMFPFVRYRRK